MSAPRIGITLPTFATSADPALVAADAAERGGLDGVFAMHHLWPINNPGRPALWPFVVLGAVAARTTRVAIGTLVARVGLLDEATFVRAFDTLRMIGGRGRVIPGVGTGDHLSAPENLAFGVPYPSAHERLGELASLVDRLADAGFRPWIGGTSAETAALADDRGLARNLWGATVAQVAAARMATWGGQVLVGRDEADLERLRARYGTRPGLVEGTCESVAAELSALGRAGAEWCVCAPLDYIDDPLRAAETICLVARQVT